MTNRGEPAPAAGFDPNIMRLGSPAGRGIRLATLVSDAIRAVDATEIGHAGGRSQVSILSDVDAALVLETHATSIRRLLETLVRDAVAAAARLEPGAATPPLREVLITAIDTGDALEIEIGDSGPPRSLPTADADAALRIGGRLEATACAEGGTAVTLRLPRRTSLARAA